VEAENLRKSTNRSKETDKQWKSRFQAQRECQELYRSIETEEQCQSRLTAQRERQLLNHSVESKEQNEARLAYQQTLQSNLTANEFPHSREERLAIAGQQGLAKRADIDQLQSAINKFANECCEICRKCFYPSQPTLHISPDV